MDGRRCTGPRAADCFRREAVRRFRDYRYSSRGIEQPATIRTLTPRGLYKDRIPRRPPLPSKTVMPRSFSRFQGRPLPDKGVRPATRRRECHPGPQFPSLCVFQACKGSFSGTETLSANKHDADFETVSTVAILLTRGSGDKVASQLEMRSFTVG